MWRIWTFDVKEGLKKKFRLKKMTIVAVSLVIIMVVLVIFFIPIIPRVCKSPQYIDELPEYHNKLCGGTTVVEGSIACFVDVPDMTIFEMIMGKE